MPPVAPAPSPITWLAPWQWHACLAPAALPTRGFCSRLLTDLHCFAPPCLQCSLGSSRHPLGPSAPCPSTCVHPRQPSHSVPLKKCDGQAPCPAQPGPPAQQACNPCGMSHSPGWDNLQSSRCESLPLSSLWQPACARCPCPAPTPTHLGGRAATQTPCLQQHSTSVLQQGWLAPRLSWSATQRHAGGSELHGCIWPLPPGGGSTAVPPRQGSLSRQVGPAAPRTR